MFLSSLGTEPAFQLHRQRKAGNRCFEPHSFPSNVYPANKRRRVGREAFGTSVCPLFTRTCVYHSSSAHFQNSDGALAFVETIPKHRYHYWLLYTTRNSDHRSLLALHRLLHQRPEALRISWVPEPITVTPPPQRPSRPSEVIENHDLIESPP